MLWSRIADGRLHPVRVEGNHGRVSYVAEGQSHDWPAPHPDPVFAEPNPGQDPKPQNERNKQTRTRARG